jgi:hypothetical protein
MTMGFAAPPSGLPKDLEVGDRVAFSFTEVEGGYRIESITKAAGDEMHMEKTP